MEIVSRAQWGARAPKDRSEIKARGFAIHYSGAAGELKEDHANCPGVVRAIQRFHMDGRKWDDIAYNFLVCVHGVAFEGRGWGIRSAANGTTAGNSQYLAICFLGGDVADRLDVSDAARRKIRELVDEGRQHHGVGSGLQPHSHFKATACPGDELRAWIAAGLPVADAPAGAGGSLPPVPPTPPAPAVHDHPTPTLSQGHRGVFVADLQRHLNAAGARTDGGREVVVDGDFGRLTANAVYNFQVMRGLTRDKIVGPRTWAALHGR